MKENNRKVIYLVLLIAVTITAIGVATFAYFSSSVNANANVPLNVATANGSVFTASSEGGIDLDLGFEKMSQANVSTNIVATDNATVTVKLDSESENDAMVCTYDLVWVWDSNDKYTTSDITLPHTEGDKTYPYELSAKIDEDEEKDLSTFAWNEVDSKYEAVIGSKEIRVNGKGSTTNTHQITVSAYNIPVNQANLFNKEFKAHIEIKNNVCKAAEKEDEGLLLATYITDTVYNSSPNQTSITAATKGAGLYKHDASLTNGAGDGTYRYAGADADVNNYVCFMGDDCTNENNLYRIISVDPITNQTKVIKATSIGNKPWNEGTYVNSAWVPEKGYTATGTTQDTAMGLTNGIVYYNIWAIQKADGSYYTATLNNYLNTEYLEEIEKKIDKIATTTWSVAGVDSSTYQKKNVKEYMNVELNNKATYEAKIGLMYGNEYGYAALPEYWTKELFNYGSSKGYDWMYTSDYPWTISRGSSSPNYSFRVVSDAYVNSSGVYNTYAVRPSFNLTSSVKITNAEAEGVGSKTKPMILI